MKIYIGSDHGGYELKEQIIKFVSKELNKNLKDFKITIVDEGTKNLESVDYPDFAKRVAKKVAKVNTTSLSKNVSEKEKTLGIIVCGTGIGVSIAANKVKGIRAANCTSVKMARLAREHNNANILTLGGRILKETLALKIVKTFLTTEFSNEKRHINRIKKIEKIENTN